MIKLLLGNQTLNLHWFVLYDILDSVNNKDVSRLVVIAQVAWNKHGRIHGTFRSFGTRVESIEEKSRKQLQTKLTEAIVSEKLGSICGLCFIWPAWDTETSQRLILGQLTCFGRKQRITPHPYETILLRQRLLALPLDCWGILWSRQALWCKFPLSHVVLKCFQNFGLQSVYNYSRDKFLRDDRNIFCFTAMQLLPQAYLPLLECSVAPRPLIQEHSCLCLHPLQQFQPLYFHNLELQPLRPSWPALPWCYWQ